MFTSWGVETTRKYAKADIEKALAALDDAKYGTILRAKGIVEGDGEWIYFDYVPGESNIRVGSAAIIGRVCVIGSEIDKKAIAELFSVEYSE